MRIWLKLLLFILLAIAGFFGLFFWQFRAPAKGSPPQRFVVIPDTKNGAIVKRLYEEGFFLNRTIFNLIWALKGKKEIEPGAYWLSKSLNAWELVDALMAGPVEKWVTIPPGKRKEQTALIIKRALNWPDDLTRSFIVIAEEGYLYPDTYLLPLDASPQEIVARLRNNFNEKFDAQIQKDLLAQNIRNDTAIKMASLIERESGGVEDKPIIAGIILNRINEGMRLEIDATVQYAITTKNFQELLDRFRSDLTAGGQLVNDDFYFWPRVTGQDLRTVVSPYNTYLNDGLPPGPICSPSLGSIKAVANPAETEAFYYLHSPDKKIHTAKTYKEHLDNIEKYLK